MKEICTFTSPEQLGEFRCKQADPLVGFTDSPYIVKNCKIKEFCTDKEVVACLAIFQVQFSGSNQAKTKGHGQSPLLCVKKEKLRELMLELCPLPCPLVAKDPILQRFAEVVSIYGSMQQCVKNGEVEKTVCAHLPR